MKIEFRCPKCSFLMFTVEPQGDTQKLHVPEPGAEFKIINKAERMGEAICPKCRTATPVDLAVLGIP